MPGFDDNLRRELGRLAEPGDPSGAFEKVMERKIRRRIARRLQVTALVVVVVAGTIGGSYGLFKVFRVVGSHWTPGTSTTGPTPSSTSPQDVLGIGLSDIERVRLQPVPEGPPSPPFERRPTAAGALSLGLIEDAIPIPLPAPLEQDGCTFGGDLVMEISDGRTIVYGPCHRPPEIDRLWARMLEVIAGGACPPSCGPSSPSPGDDCSAFETTVTGDFDGDGIQDLAVVARSDCLGEGGSTPYSLSVTWGGGAAGGVALPDCQSACGAFAVSDLDGNGTDELALLVELGSSTQFVEFYELNVSEAFGQQAVLVAPPGAEGFPPDQPAVFPLGGSVTHLDFLSCFQAEDGTNQVASDGAVLSSDQTEYAVHETVFVLDMTLDTLYGQFVVQSTKDYIVPFDPKDQTDFQLPGRPCLNAEG